MIFDTLVPTFLLAAMVLDAIVGDPKWIWRRVPHPRVGASHVVNALELALNRPEFSAPLRLSLGTVMVGGLIALAIGIGLVVHAIPIGALRITVEIVLVAILLGQKNLYLEVNRVFRAFAAGGLAVAQTALRQISGRDASHFDDVGVSRVAIESLATGMADRVIAPALWYLILGLPGLIAYVFINAASVAVGHGSDRYRAFGWTAVRLNAAMSYAPARQTGWLIWMQGYGVAENLSAQRRIIRRDAPLDPSLNAGWPKAAMAVRQDVRLGGPRVDTDTAEPHKTQDHAWLNPEGRNPKAPNIQGALQSYVYALYFFTVFIVVPFALGGLALFFSMSG